MDHVEGVPKSLIHWSAALFVAVAYKDAFRERIDPHFDTSYRST